MSGAKVTIEIATPPPFLLPTAPLSHPSEQTCPILAAPHTGWPIAPMTLIHVTDLSFHRKSRSSFVLVLTALWLNASGIFPNILCIFYEVYYYYVDFCHSVIPIRLYITSAYSIFLFPFHFISFVRWLTCKLGLLWIIFVTTAELLFLSWLVLQDKEVWIRLLFT
jgi:hypothetical protein